MTIKSKQYTQAQAIVTALTDRWRNLHMEGWEDEEAEEIIARILGHQWIPPEIKDQFGKVSDEQLAARIGVSTQTVRYYRRKAQIPPFEQQRGRQAGSQPTVWTPEMVEKLGTLPDRQLARQWGLSISRICRKRQELGIKPHTPPKRSWERKMKETHDAPATPTG